MNISLENNSPSVKFSTDVIQLVKERDNIVVFHSPCQSCLVESYCSLIHEENSLYVGKSKIIRTPHKTLLGLSHCLLRMHA
jgi:hypothetical protein